MEDSHEKQPDFVQNWQVDTAKLEAVHNSGVKFTLLDRNEKGDIEVKFTAPKNWISEQRKMFPDHKIEDTLSSLKNEFGTIMQDIPISAPVKPLDLLAQIKKSTIKNR